MYIPSRFAYEVLVSEKIGVLCESNNKGDKAIIAKLPTSTIKAIALGAKVDFYVFTTSRKPYYLALCMKIFDNKCSPMHALLAQRWQNSNNILDFSFFDSELDFVLFDETDASVQESKIKIKTNFRNKRVRNVLQNMKFTSSNDYDAVNHFTDSVCADLGFNYDSHPHYPIASFKFSTEIKDIHTVKTIHVNEQSSTHYDVIKDIDGARQERQIYQSLCLMDNSKTAISPLVTIGKKERELTDVLTITQNQQLIAVESKCLQVDKDAVGKSYERTAASIVKHCKKALSQLEGVYKSIKRGERIYDEHDNTLLLEGNNSFYGIVLIDEFRPSNDWEEVINLMQSLSNTHNVCLNIISISEMIYTMKLCTSNTSLFIELLENRQQACIDANTIDIRFTNSSLPTMVE
ncbi:hypothetical protein F9L16_02165 [Agarivorans sp. B2Z047]|uniref:hypothetical protein n=1 Tax=Agarivorans sp. B2Z047 TaxID=2652721 RepID=UPI00128DB85C|nr:hypothetical protein [Agarivorans sp. B2Z047]MPW27799.1 hypothetical protein [Agarivorans sp. B2Z047]UQN44366.1 hypothetical protein LQZ07_07800 [Agarivorans sp. B2Z047]